MEKLNSNQKSLFINRFTAKEQTGSLKQRMKAAKALLANDSFTKEIKFVFIAELIHRNLADYSYASFNDRDAEDMLTNFCGQHRLKTPQDFERVSDEFLKICQQRLERKNSRRLQNISKDLVKLPPSEIEIVLKSIKDKMARDYERKTTACTNDFQVIAIFLDCF